MNRANHMCSRVDIHPWDVGKVADALAKLGRQFQFAEDSRTGRWTAYWFGEAADFAERPNQVLYPKNTNPPSDGPGRAA